MRAFVFKSISGMERHLVQAVLSAANSKEPLSDESRKMFTSVLKALDIVNANMDRIDILVRDGKHHCLTEDETTDLHNEFKDLSKLRDTLSDFELLLRTKFPRIGEPKRSIQQLMQLVPKAQAKAEAKGTDT